MVPAPIIVVLYYIPTVVWTLESANSEEESADSDGSSSTDSSADFSYISEKLLNMSDNISSPKHSTIINTLFLFSPFVLVHKTVHNTFVIYSGCLTLSHSRSHISAPI